MSSFIKKALISEKSYLAAANGKFTFIVDKHADKDSVAKAVEGLFKVNVLSVNTANYIGKIKTTKRVTGKRNDFKKVILTLKPGQKIDLFELESDKDKEDKAKAKKETKKVEKIEKVKEAKEVKSKE